MEKVTIVTNEISVALNPQRKRLKCRETVFTELYYFWLVKLPKMSIRWLGENYILENRLCFIIVF